MSKIYEVKNLSVEFPMTRGIFGKKVGSVKAVNDVSFTINQGETLGLVGESGCGKSTLGKALLRLIKPTHGSFLFNDVSVFDLNKRDLQSFRKKIQMIFQDPYSSLNPRMKVGQILSEPLKIHNLALSSDRKKKVLDILSKVGLREDAFDRYPHEFSGGQRQRIGIARALMVEPEFIIADEPVSALDVSIQAQVLNLLKSIQKEFGLTYLFISHDLNVIRYLCDRVVVMYLGKIMEVIPKEKLIDSKFNLHPYTQALIQSAPRKHPNSPKNLTPLTGDLPSPMNPPQGCVFHPRCPEASDKCRVEVPQVKEVDGRSVACHLR